METKKEKRVCWQPQCGREFLALLVFNPLTKRWNGPRSCPQCVDWYEGKREAAPQAKLWHQHADP